MPTPELPRHTPAEYARLYASIKRHGVLVPILETTDDKIIEGRVRDKIATELGQWAPRVKVPKELNLDSPESVALLRAELHTAARQLSRAQVDALIQYHLEATPNMSDREIAEKIGTTGKTVGKRRPTAESPQLPRQGKDGKTRRMPIVLCNTKAEAHNADKHLDAVAHTLPGGPSTHRTIRTTNQAQQRQQLVDAANEVTLPEQFNLFTSDFRKQTIIKPNSVDVMIGDAPWGDDSFPRAEFAAECFRLIKPGGILAAYTGNDTLAQWFTEYLKAGFHYLHPMALLRQETINNTKSVYVAWAPMFLFRKPPFKGRWKGFHILNDVVKIVPIEKEYHKWQQPVSDILGVIRTSPPGSLIADITMCSGTSAVATLQAGEKRRFAGCDIDGKMVKLARSRLFKAMEAKTKTG